ncbi:MAG: 30S ribosomal protein S12 methylthiotransferase RimO [Anaerolineae bacterium]
MRYYLLTLGCPKNLVDSEGMEILLQQAGHQPCHHPEEAEVLIVNTCGFIEPAKEESLSALKDLSSAKRSDQILVAAGCLAERYDGELSAQVPTLDAVLSTRRWREIAIVVDRLRGETPADIPEPGRLKPTLSPLPRQAQGASAYLKIADGCSAPCAFCTIPSIKGPLKSKPAAAVVQEARQLVAQGVKEIILIAQDTTAYGYDLSKKDALAPLIEAILEAVPDLRWLRLMYAYPGRVTPRLIEVMASHQQVCPYLDVPLQHAHPETLRRMRRPSNPALARRMIEHLRQAMPDISLRTTFIVGYPGETEEEFQRLLDFMEEMAFDKVGIFPYWQEEGTPAATMPDQLPQEVKEERRDRAMKLQQRISLAKNRQMIGQDLEVLMEGSGDGLSVARSYRDAPEVDGLVILEEELPVGEMVQVRITGALEYDLIGKLNTEG